MMCYSDQASTVHVCKCQRSRCLLQEIKPNQNTGAAREAVMRKAAGLHKNPPLSAARLQHRGHVIAILGENSFQERLHPRFDECEDEKKKTWESTKRRRWEGRPPVFQRRHLKLFKWRTPEKPRHPPPPTTRVCVCGLLRLVGFRGHGVTSGYWNVYVSHSC